MRVATVVAGVMLALATMLVAPAAAFADDPAPVPSDTASAVPAPDPATPQPVQNLRWSALSATTVRLSWDAPPDAPAGTAYTAVARVVGSGADGIGQVLSVQTAATSAVFTGVRPGSVLVPEVATDARSAAGHTDVGPAWTQPPVPASVPRRLQLAFVLPGGVPGLRVSWAPPASNGGAPITGYRVRVSRSGAEVSSAERTVAAGARSVSFADVDSGNAYLSTVVAITQAGDGAVAGSNLVDTGNTPGPIAIGVGAVPVGTVPSGTSGARTSGVRTSGGGASGSDARGSDTGAQVAAPRVQADATPIVMAAVSFPVLALLGSVFGILLAGAFAILLVIRRFGI